MRMSTSIALLAALLAVPLPSAAEDTASAETQDTESAGEAARLATRMLYEQFDVEPGTVEVISVEPETWVGPGVRCGQAVTEESTPQTSGHRVRLRIESGTFDVRVAAGAARICSIGPDTASFEPGRIEPELAGRVLAAKTDLASRLNTVPDKIEVLEAVTVVWRDSSIGCPKPGMDYLQVLTAGTRIRLKFGPAVFHYHGVGEGPPVYCEQPAEVEPLPATVSTE